MKALFLQFKLHHQLVRRPSGSNPCDPRYTLKTLKHPPCVMVLGCFSAHGCGALHFMEKRQKVNSEVSIDILNEKLKHFMCVAGTNIFQQDNAPCHTARRVIKWLADNDIELKIYGQSSRQEYKSAQTKRFLNWKQLYRVFGVLKSYPRFLVN